MKKTFAEFIFCTSGATAIEYALVAGGIALVIVVAVGNLGTKVNSLFNNVANAFP